MIIVSLYDEAVTPTNQMSFALEWYRIQEKESTHTQKR